MVHHIYSASNPRLMPMDAVKFFKGFGYTVHEIEFRARREVVGEIPKGQVFLATP